jgi:xylitol oxidase
MGGMGAAETNWAGNLAYRARRVHRPSSVEELRRIVARSDRVRPLGTRHSFNGIADTTGDLVDVTALPFEAELDTDRRQVRVGGGSQYGRLATYLHERGFALHNLASLPHISVAGACATATHGSGDRNGNLGTAVGALEVVTAAGDLVEITRSDGADELAGAVVGLGALGVVTTLTLDVEPTYDVWQYVLEDLPTAALQDRFDDITASGYSVSLFTDWRTDRIAQTWVKQRTDQGADAADLVGRPADGPRHPIRGMPATHCTVQGGVPGPWHERLPHFRLEHTPSAGEELQSEYLVPRHHATSAFAAVAGIREHVAPVLQVCEIRTVAADELWLSPSYRRDAVSLHFTWRKDPRAVAPVLARIEDVLEPYDPRPHWGKLFALAPDTLRGRYPRAADFQALRTRFDPTGKFGNEMLDELFPTSH